MVAIAAHDLIVDAGVDTGLDRGADRGSEIGKIHEPDENVLLWFFVIFSILGIAIVMA